MQLNLTTDYAIRLIAYLATVERMASSPEIARAMNIPPKYITTIVGKLKKAGYVKTVIGPGGGYELDCVPEKTTLRDIISTMEGGIQLKGCSVCDPNCILQSGRVCSLASSYDSVRALMDNALKEISIADLVLKQRLKSKTEEKIK